MLRYSHVSTCYLPDLGDLHAGLFLLFIGEQKFAIFFLILTFNLGQVVMGTLSYMIILVQFDAS